MTVENKYGRKRRGRRLAFAILPWLVALLLIEGGTRVIHPSITKPIYHGYPDGLVIPHDKLGHAYQPIYKGHFPAAEYSDIAIETNSYGFRDSAWRLESSLVKPRVMILGDSVTFGSPLPVEQRFTEQAGDFLREKGLLWRTCNCGVNGYNIEQYTKLLRLVGPGLKPEIVLVGFVLNDAEPMSPDDARRIAIAEGIAAGSAWARLRRLAERYHFEPNRSYAYALARREIMLRLWQSPEYAEKMAKKYNQKTEKELTALYKTGEGLPHFREQMRQMRQFTEQTLKAKFGVLVFPYRWQLANEDSSISRMITGVLDELDIPYVDIYGRFLPLFKQNELYVPRDDCHPNAEGHRIAGSVMADLMVQMLTTNESDQ